MASYKSTSSRPATHPEASSGSVLGPDGKLSAASKAASLRYAKPHELPSFPSVGIDEDLDYANSNPSPGPSVSANRAAALAANDQGSQGWWQYKGSSTGRSAAGLAFAKNTSPTIDLGYTEDGHKKALMAATLSVKTGGRARTTSDSNKPGSAAMNAANGKNLHMSREMFTEHPPVAIEVEEQRRKDALRASAVSMAKSMYALEQTKSADAAKNAAKGIYTSETEGLVARSLTIAYPGLQAAAQKLANDRLAKMDPDGIMAYRQHYGYGTPGPTQLTAENMRKKERAGRNLDADSDEDEAQASKIRGQMSTFNAQISSIDAKKREKDRAAVMAAAEKLVQARMHDMDEKVFHDTGKVPPSIMQSWEAAARAKASENSEQRMLTHGKVHIGGGKYMDQSEINAIAAARMQPILDETTATAQRQRERDEEIRIATEERRKAEAEEKAKLAEEKAEKSRKKDEEKLRVYQEKFAEKQKNQEERAELARVKAEEKAERDKIAAEEKNLRDIKNAEEKAKRDKIAAEQKAERDKIKAEEKVKRDAEKAELAKVKAEEKTERERVKAQEKEEQRQRLEAQKEKDRLFKEEQAAATTTTAEEPVSEEIATGEVISAEPVTEVVTTTEAPVALEASEELPTGTASEETVTELTDTPASSGEASTARAIAARIMGEPSTEWGARDEPLTEEYTEGEKSVEDDAATIKATSKEAVVTDGDEEAVVPTPVAENMEEASDATITKEVTDEDVSPGRTPATTTSSTPLSPMRSPTSPAPREKGSRRKSFFDKFKGLKRSSKAPKGPEPIVAGNPSIGPGIVGSTGDEAEEPATIIADPTSSETAAPANSETAALSGDGAADTNGVADTAEPTDTEDSIYDDPAAESTELDRGKGKDVEGDNVSSIFDDDEEQRGRKSYSSNEHFEEARDQFDDETSVPETNLVKEQEQSPARSASKFQEEL